MLIWRYTEVVTYPAVAVCFDPFPVGGVEEAAGVADVFSAEDELLELPSAFVSPVALLDSAPDESAELVEPDEPDDDDELVPEDLESFL